MRKNVLFTAMAVCVVLQARRADAIKQVAGGSVSVGSSCSVPEPQTYATKRGDRLNGPDGVLARFGTTMDELRGANPGVLVPVAYLKIVPGSPYVVTSVTVAVPKLRWYLPPGRTITIPASRQALNAARQCEANRVATLEARVHDLETRLAAAQTASKPARSVAKRTTARQRRANAATAAAPARNAVMTRAVAARASDQVTAPAPSRRVLTSGYILLGAFLVVAAFLLGRANAYSKLRKRSRDLDQEAERLAAKEETLRVRGQDVESREVEVRRIKGLLDKQVRELETMARRIASLDPNASTARQLERPSIVVGGRDTVVDPVSPVVAAGPPPENRGAEVHCFTCGELVADLDEHQRSEHRPTTAPGIH